MAPREFIADLGLSVSAAHRGLLLNAKVTLVTLVALVGSQRETATQSVTRRQAAPKFKIAICARIRIRFGGQADESEPVGALTAEARLSADAYAPLDR